MPITAVLVTFGLWTKSAGCVKYIFLGTFVALVLATLGTWATLPEQVTGQPVLYWVTDPNPVRAAQIDDFHAWMQIHVPAEEHFELRLDAANNSPEKKVIQSVSGVGGDIMDVYGAGDMHYFMRMGILEDITERARADGFTPEKTSPVIAPQLSVGDAQYMFPCNLSADMFWVNVGALEKFGVEVPAEDWTYDDLERIGLEFVKRANEGLEHRRYFLASSYQLIFMLRDLGLDTLNETLTASTLDDARLVSSLERLHRWRYDLNILPTLADQASINTESAHGGSETQLFRTGNLAMLMRGRWALTQFRLWEDFKDLKLAIRPPSMSTGGFRNSVARLRGAVMYKGSQNKDLATHFLRYLASEAYSNTIVESADAMPPLPSATRSDAFLRPAEYPSEWPVHGAFAKYFDAYGVPKSESAFVTSRYCDRELGAAEEAVMATPPLYTPEEAAARAQRRINDRIQLNLRENESLRPAYDEAVKRQAQIDALKAAGEPIPAALISNVFYLNYYRAKGMLAD